MREKNKLAFVVFTIYFILLIWLILFKFALYVDDIPHMRNINLIPFADSVIINGKIYIREIIYNVLVFVPLGVYLMILMPKLTFWKKIGIVASVSFVFETIQYIFAIGGSDITDVIGNTLGGVVGIFLFSVINKALKKYTITVFNVVGIIIEVVALGMITLLTLANL